MVRLCRFAAALVVLPVLAQVNTNSPAHRISSPAAFFDDAETAAPGSVAISSDFSYGRVLSGHDIAFPSTYVTVGLRKRLDFSAGFGYVRSQFENVRISGIGDTYLGVKGVLVSETRWRPAVAVKPMLEILGTPSIANNLLAPKRVNVLLPLTLQKSFPSFRVYYTGGYFSRGIQFHSLAYELNRWARVTPAVVVSHSRLTRELDLVSELGLNRSRSDALCIVSVPLTPRWGLFGSAGRTFGRTDGNSTRIQVSGGVSFTFRAWGER